MKRNIRQCLIGMTDGVRIHKQQGGTKNFAGPTQAGISLVWTIGSNK